MEPDKDDSMDEMPISMPPSINGHQNPRAQAQRPTNFGAFLDNDEMFFNGLLTYDGINGNPMTQLASSSSTNTKSDLSMLPAATDTLPLKRTITSPYWNEASPVESPSKRLQSGSSDSMSGTRSNGGNSMAALLNQLPQSAAFHQNSFLGSLGDGIFRQQNQLLGMNWNS